MILKIYAWKKIQIYSRQGAVQKMFRDGGANAMFIAWLISHFVMNILPRVSKNGGILAKNARNCILSKKNWPREVFLPIEEKSAGRKLAVARPQLHDRSFAIIWCFFYSTLKNTKMEFGARIIFDRAN